MIFLVIDGTRRWVGMSSLSLENIKVKELQLHDRQL